MKTLFVAPTLPVPTSGGRTRLFNLIKQMAGRHQVSVISFIQSSEREMLPAIAPRCQHLELIA
ncbi:MAG: glycosyl transferase family 1, partial [Anaerolineae bacterium]|nr:glycosyl transferase family 1 [Anaerolineae bacterium]